MKIKVQAINSDSTLRSCILSFVSLSGNENRLLGEGTWVAAGRVMTSLGTLLGVRLLTECLDPSVYGTIVLMLGLTALGQGLFCRPLIQAAYQFYPDMVSNGNVRFLRRTIYRFLLVTTTGLVAIFLLLGTLYVWRSDASYWFFVALVACLIVEIPTALETTLLSAARRQRAVAIWEGGNACLKPIMAVLVVVSLGPSPLSVLVGYFSVMVVTFTCARAVLSNGEERRGYLPRSEALRDTLNQQIVSFALPLTPLALVGWLTSASDRYIIGGLEGLGPAGVYSAAYGVTSMPVTMAGSIIMQTLRPVYNRAVAQRHESVAKQTFIIWLLATISLCVPGFVLITVLREWIVGLVLAEQYRLSAPLLPWLAAGFTFFVVAQVFECTLYAFKRTRLVLLGQSIAAALAVIVTVPMITLWGLKGAAIACPIYFAGYLIIMILLSRRVVTNGA